MMRLLSAIYLVFLTAGHVQAGPGGDCTCRYAGGDVAEGQTACIKTAKGMTLARCERVLNNTSWTFLDQPCPLTYNIGPAEIPRMPIPVLN
jgi:hypothetical protein